MSLSWSRIALFALALVAASAHAGSAYHCTGADGAVTLAETCPPGTVDSRYLGDTGRAPRPSPDAYNPYSIMEQARRIDERHAAERQAAADRAAAADRRSQFPARPDPVPPPAEVRSFSGGYVQPPYSGYRPGYPPWSGAPRRPDGRQDRGMRRPDVGNSIHPESAGANITPGYRMGDSAPSTYQMRPYPPAGTVMKSYSHTPKR